MGSSPVVRTNCFGQRAALATPWLPTNTASEIDAASGSRWPEIGDATFLVEDKALLFMRYISKHIAFLEQARATQAEVK